MEYRFPIREISLGKITLNTGRYNDNNQQKWDVFHQKNCFLFHILDISNPYQ